MPPVLYTASVLCPMSGPPLADGAVLVDGGRIRAVGTAADLRGSAPRAHHVDGVLVPGFVNASTRFEHADARAGTGGGIDGWDDDTWRRSAHRGVQEALRAGVTTAGDVVARGAGVPPACRAGLAGDSFVEAPLGADVDATVAALERAIGQPAPGRRVGIAATATAGPAGFDRELLAALAGLCARRGAPLRIRGDAAVGDLDGCAALMPGASIEPGRPLPTDEIELLARRRVTVVARPRSHAEPLEDYVAAGVGVALGSGAEHGPDVLAQAAAWAVAARQRGTTAVPTAGGPVPLAEHAVRLVTADGAAAAGWDGAGVLAAGRRADLAGLAVRTTPADAYADLLAHGTGRQVLTVVGGVRKARRADADEPWPPVDRTGR